MKCEVDIAEAAIIKMLHNESIKRLALLNEKNAGAKLTNQEKTVDSTTGTVVSKGLKLRRKSDNTLMTVSKTGDNFVQLSTPAGELYKVMIADLDKDFELD